MYALGNFLFSHWLWSMTFDVSHIFFTALFSFLLLWFFYGRSFMRAKIVALSIPLLSWLVFTGVVVGILIIYLDWDYVPNGLPAQIPSIDVLLNCARLAVIYAVIQTVILLLINLQYKLRVGDYIRVFWVSNLLAFGVSYLSLRLFGW